MSEYMDYWNMLLEIAFCEWLKPDNEDKWNKQFIIQIGPLKGTKIRDLAKLILKVVQKDNKIHFDNLKPTGDFGRSCDCSIAKDNLGWQPDIELEDGLTDLKNWLNSEIN